jgi:ubiquitin-activating enzyme E1
VINNDKYPSDNDADRAETLKLTNARLEELKASGGHQVELEAEVFNKAVSWAGSSISPMSAFFGGIVAQEIVKFTGKYTPLKQWLHFDIYETLPREADVDRKLTGTRHDD